MAKLLCEDCHQNAGSIMCCGLVFCLKHYHCTFHSEHPKNAKIIDREAYNAHIDSFKELRKKAFSEVYLLLQDVDEEYHQALKKEDPLAFFAEKRKSQDSHQEAPAKATLKKSSFWVRASGAGRSKSLQKTKIPPQTNVEDWRCFQCSWAKKVFPESFGLQVPGLSKWRDLLHSAFQTHRHQQVRNLGQKRRGRCPYSGDM